MSGADPLAVDPITAYPQSDADDAVSSDDVDTDLDPKRSKLEEDESELKKPQNQNLEESRRLFQRLWTDEDEIKILKGFLDFTSSRGTTFASHQYDTGPFYDQIKNELELDFNKNQLTEKLRRLKKKYRNTANRMAKQGNNFSFRSQHEMETFDIAKKIWSASITKLSNSDDEFSNQINMNNLGSSNELIVSDKKSGPPSRRKRNRKRNLDDSGASPALLQLPAAPANENVVKEEVHILPVEPTASAVQTPVVQAPIMQPVNKTASVNGVIEETVKSCISPIIKELLSSVASSNGCFGMGLNLPPSLNFSNLGSLEDEKWKKQQILEMEVYLKRVELIRDQIKLTLEELKGSNEEAKLEG